MANVNEIMHETADEHIDEEIMHREQEISSWTRDKQQQAAMKEGLEMTDAHWAVIRFLREYYVEYGRASSGRVVATALDEAFENEGGGAYLQTLFPKGPVAQGSRIAGIPEPPYTEDKSFGSAM